MLRSGAMEIFDGHRALFRPLFAPAIALGNFDGVHVGHQQLLKECVRASSRLGGDAVVLTFDPHPAQVLAPDRAPPLLTSRDRKLELMAAAGISACIVEPFDRELAALGPDEFAKQVLCDIIAARHVVVGYDFSYGNKREGTTHTLQEFGRAHGFEVQVIEPVAVDGIVASSTKAREMLSAGDLDGVRLLLGRNYDVDGTVVRGAGRGRTIGVPTANIETSGVALPMGGVYAVRVTIIGDAGQAADQPLSGVANLGTNPTFSDAGALSLEAHILDFDGDLYGQTLRVEFVRRLRGEKRFSGADALIAQIRADIAEGRKLLASRDPGPGQEVSPGQTLGSGAKIGSGPGIGTE